MTPRNIEFHLQLFPFWKWLKTEGSCNSIEKGVNQSNFCHFKKICLHF